jgi:hypothetical protein
MTDFDWNRVHDFDPQEAGRTEEEVEALIVENNSRMIEEPE